MHQWIALVQINFSEISVENRNFSFKKMRFKMSSVKWRPFCLGINVLGYCCYCTECRTYLIPRGSWDLVICPIYLCLTVCVFPFILFDLCLFITIFNFILNYVLIATFWIFTDHKISIMLIIYSFIWNYWIIYFVTCLEVFWNVMS